MRKKRAEQGKSQTVGEGSNKDIPQIAFWHQANERGQLGKIQESLGKDLAHIANHFKLGSWEMKHFSFLNCMAIFLSTGSSGNRVNAKCCLLHLIRWALTEISRPRTLGHFCCHHPMTNWISWGKHRSWCYLRTSRDFRGVLILKKWGIERGLQSRKGLTQLLLSWGSPLPFTPGVSHPGALPA